ncbi:Carotenoid 9,10(9',10')-cleavage dioxygenase 1 [Apostasia shenzhenica]|uniref:Carotenoid 9,10(9',10')-cleavage dioxygenase 1 n=1 Tax=Apostasia shenzhenica TaxID=1088818 RepID=A0A2H9ZQZ0_9ASPA|nr:Carotenoid 9,10(9',10')-cleavage dioxygenase 1 [Apostasia shenzhenica]
MAASFSPAVGHFQASAERPVHPRSFPPLSRLASSFSSFVQPVLQELRRAPALATSEMAGNLVKRASGRLLNSIVELGFEFSDQPWLLPSQSNFEPVEEIAGEAVVVGDLEGEIPDDFPEGVYIRNGSNPMFGALQSASSVLGLSSETWLEGEGMLHALSFSRSGGCGGSNGSAGGGWTVSYKNCFVQSDTFRLERRLRRPSFLPTIEGDATSIVAALLLNQLRFGKMHKEMSNTGVFEHSGRVFSISENHMPYEIDLLSLETIGHWNLSKAWDRPFIAHPKKAPGSGELVFAGASANKPFLVLGVLSADGKKIKHKVDLRLDRSIICHDIGVTKRYNIILDMPLTSDINRLMRGGPLIKYEKESYARIGVMPRYGNAESVTWFEVNPYCTFHIVNCYETEDEVVVRGFRADGSIIPGPDLGRNKFQWFSEGFRFASNDEILDEESNEGTFFSRLHEWRLNMRSGCVNERYLTGSEFSSELPMINDSFQGLYNQYTYAQVVNSEASSNCGLPKYGCLAKFYLDEKDNTKTSVQNISNEHIKVKRHELGANKFCSGAAFVSKQGKNGEDDGWLISFVHDEHTNKSQVHIIDAKNFEGLPVAVFTLPRRVPYGFHGVFIPRSSNE